MNDYFTKDQILLLKKTMLSQFSDDEQQLFITRCERDKLDPFSGQIHPTLRKTKSRDDKGKEVYIPKLVIVIGIYGLLDRAVRTGNYDGTEIFWCGPGGDWKQEWLEEENPAAAKAIVHVKNRSKPEVAIARWVSFAQQSKTADGKYELTNFWYKMPDYMIAKCARAAALRAAFPEQLSDLFLREELASQPDLEIVSGDEEKIATNQEQEKKIHIPGAKVVESKGKRPSPAEALEPAFPEDREDRAPAFAQQLAKDFPKEAKEAQAAPAPPAAKEPADELSMEPFPEPAPAQTASQVAAVPEPTTPPAWKTHVIKGITHPRFHMKVLGELGESDRLILENQWMPAVREQWDKANAAQKADYPLVEACIAYYKMAKPWE
jgi:phage recombination protein Bet